MKKQKITKLFKGSSLVLAIFLALLLVPLQNVRFSPSVEASPDSNVWQVGASSDDCVYRATAEYWNTAYPHWLAGSLSTTNFDWRSAGRFTEVNIPQGATIVSAFLKGCVEGVYGGTDCRTKIRGEAIDDTSTFSTQTDYLGRTKTSAAVDWDFDPSGWSVDSWHTSPDIKSVVQEIVDRAGWSAGNDLVIFHDDDGSPTSAQNLFRFYSYDSSPTKAPKLEVTWIVPVSASDTWQVGASSDDCMYRATPAYWSTNYPHWMVGSYSAAQVDYRSAGRFTSVNIPQGATIVSAFLKGCVEGVYGGTDCRTKIRGEAVDDASTFSTSAEYLGRTKTGAAVDWDYDPSGWSVDSWHTSPDIKSVVQEIVDRPGWSAGNDVVIFHDDDGSPTTAMNLARFYTYDSLPISAPKLEITWIEEGNWVILNSPAEDSTGTSLTVDFKYIPVFYQAIQNASLWTNATGSWDRTQWNATAVINYTENTISYTFSTGGAYLWNIEVFNSTDSVFASVNRTVIVDMPPRYRNVGSNATTVPENGVISLYAQGYDEAGLRRAYLSTNESGTWRNYTDYCWMRYSNNPVLRKESAADFPPFGDGIVFNDKVYFYYGTDGGEIKLVISEDGFNFGPSETVLTDGSYVLVPSCIVVNDTVYMAYRRGTGGACGGAWAGDGKSFTLSPSNPICSITGGDTAWACSAFDPEALFYRDGKWYMFFNGAGLIGGVREVGLKTATDFNGPWTSSSENPILTSGGSGSWYNIVFCPCGLVRHGVTYLYACTRRVNAPPWDQNIAVYACRNESTLEDFGTAPTHSALEAQLPEELLWDTPSIVHFQNKYIMYAMTRNESGSDSVYAYYVEGDYLPMAFNDIADTWTWSNFTWCNSSITAGTTIQWRIYYEDMYGNVNGTSIQTFTVVTLLPLLSNEYPEDGATDVPLNPTLSIHAQALDPMTIYFYRKVGVTWQQIGTPQTGGNGTYTQATTNMNAYSTTYYWKVCVTDGTRWTNETYSFMTRPENYPPSLSNPSPEDGEHIGYFNPELSIDVSDGDGDPMNVTFYKYVGYKSKIYVAEDARLKGTGAPDTNINDAYLTCGWYEYYNGKPWHSILKFDVSGIPSGCIIVDADLVLTQSGYSGSGTSYVYSVTDDSWSETTVTYNNAPSHITQLASAPIDAVSDIFSSDTLTNFVKDEFGGDQTVSLKLVNGPTSGTNFAQYYSKDYDGYDSYLEITWVPAASPGVWQPIGGYTNVGDGAYSQNTTGMNDIDTTYYWRVSVTDGKEWTNETYSFTTTDLTQKIGFYYCAGHPYAGPTNDNNTRYIIWFAREGSYPHTGGARIQYARFDLNKGWVEISNISTTGETWLTPSMERTQYGQSFGYFGDQYHVFWVDGNSMGDCELAHLSADDWSDFQSMTGGWTYIDPSLGAQGYGSVYAFNNSYTVVVYTKGFNPEGHTVSYWTWTEDSGFSSYIPIWNTSTGSTEFATRDCDHAMLLPINRTTWYMYYKGGSPNAGTNQKLLLVKSFDAGQTWGTPTVVMAPPNIAYAGKHGFVRYGDTFYMMISTTSQLVLYESTDGENWVNPQVIHTGGSTPGVGGLCSHIVMLDQSHVLWVSCEGPYVEDGSIRLGHVYGGVYKIPEMTANPGEPSDPYPSNGASLPGGTSETNLQVDVHGDQTYDVAFYWANDTFIGEANLLREGDTASIEVSGLSDGQTYEWYTIARGATYGYWGDPATTSDENRSDTWSFSVGITPRLEMNPTNVTCSKYCENFTITINLTGAVNVEDFAFEIWYNTSLIDYVNLTWGTFLDGAKVIDNINEAAGVIEGHINPGTLVTGSGWLLNITFHADKTLIWKDCLGWVNKLEGQVWFHWAELSYPGSVILRYEEWPGGKREIEVNKAYYTYLPIQGDVDSDGDVDIMDLRTVAAYYNKKDGDLNWASASVYDLNCDGIIDIFDLVIIAVKFGTTYP